MHFPAQWCYTESWCQIKQHKPNLKILVAICTAQINMQSDSKWPNLIVWGHPQYKNTWKGHGRLQSPKSTWIPYDLWYRNALENISPCKCENIILGYPFVKFRGCIPCQVDDAPPFSACPTSLPAPYHVLRPTRSRSRPRCVVSWASIGTTLQECAKISWESDVYIVIPH